MMRLARAHATGYTSLYAAARSIHMRASPSGKASASQADTRGFESRCPLQERTAPSNGGFFLGSVARQLRAMDKQMTRIILRKASKTRSVNPYTGRFPATAMRKARRTRRRLSRTLRFDRKRRTARQPSEPLAERPANARTTTLPRAQQCENRACSNAARRRGRPSSVPGAGPSRMARAMPHDAAAPHTPQRAQAPP